MVWFPLPFFIFVLIFPVILIRSLIVPFLLCLPCFPPFCWHFYVKACRCYFLISASEIKSQVGFFPPNLSGRIFWPGHFQNLQLINDTSAADASEEDSVETCWWCCLIITVISIDLWSLFSMNGLEADSSSWDPEWMKTQQKMKRWSWWRCAVGIATSVLVVVTTSWSGSWSRLLSCVFCTDCWAPGPRFKNLVLPWRDGPCGDND